MKLITLPLMPDASPVERLAVCPECDLHQLQSGDESYHRAGCSRPNAVWRNYQVTPPVATNREFLDNLAAASRGRFVVVPIKTRYIALAAV